ncbi:hypothetical protein Q7C36_017078 [Tachysurus vachellii]|uniref:PiggyBac transposable element-derived protein 4 C-terminal zinc-finger domain-containing protein n=1 Tax=Tachysurus vachellii TaxID=175792 RepID=A0AA88S717_TACVA|nr:hypothetical protein Q7C36_017078 [Tachysurus vachellii]
MESSTAPSEPIDGLQESSDDYDNGNNLSHLEDKDSDEETLGLGESDSADESEDDEQLPPPVKPHKSAQSKSPPAWKTFEDADVTPPAIRFQPARPPGVQLNPANTCDHVPVPVAKLSTDVSQVASQGRRTCVVCRSQNSKKSGTPWKCRKCDVPLCLQLTRNCFEEWHKTVRSRIQTALLSRRLKKKKKGGKKTGCPFFFAIRFGSSSD